MLKRIYPRHLPMNIKYPRKRYGVGLFGTIITFSLLITCWTSATFAFTSISQRPLQSKIPTSKYQNVLFQQGIRKIACCDNQFQNRNSVGSIRCGVASSSTELSSNASSSSSPKNTEPRNRNDANMNIKNKNNENNKRRRKNNKNKQKRTKSQPEIDRERLRQYRQAQYELLRKQSSLQSGDAKNSTPTIWGFEALFPEPVWDNEAIYRDLYEVTEMNEKQRQKSVARGRNADDVEPFILIGSNYTESYRKPTTSSRLPYEPRRPMNVTEILGNATNTTKTIVDQTLTRMVEDRVYGFRRPNSGDYYYEVSSMSEGAVRFTRDGTRLGNPLKLNSDRLTYHAKKELAKGHLEEARELYEEAVRIDPRDGRGYLGLSRISTKRRDFTSAKKYLKLGIANSYDPETNGSNAFLLQALGCLEERIGHLSEAEKLYIQAAKERPYHAAAWVALAQLRTRKLRKGAHAGRVCYQSAERELIIAGKPPSSHVYTAWASLEYRKAGDFRRAKELFEKAVQCDPKCSAAYLQYGVMEADREHWDEAKACFEKVLKFDQNNSRVLQAYAIMESKRPGGDSRDVIDLFERALQANPRDAGVLQAYALFVVDLGDINAGRELLRRATEVDQKHAPAWQAWGVLETRYGTPTDARDIFQQGIWACAQSGGGQSGGRRCARLWQAWGVLESLEGDHAAARRCFSRALDADTRNIAAVTAWARMEQETGNILDARSIFERALKRQSGGSNDKMTLWKAYETMEARVGNINEAQMVYQRSMRDTMISTKDEYLAKPEVELRKLDKPPPMEEILKKSKEVEVVNWRSTREFGEGEVWFNKGSIEGKVPASKMRKTKKNSRKEE